MVMEQSDEQILTDSFFQGQVATTLMRLSLELRFQQYVSSLLLNKVTEAMPKEKGDDTKRAVLDAWYDTELNNAMKQIEDAQDAMRETGIIPMSEQQMTQPILNLLKPMYADLCDRLKLPVENPKAEEPA